MSDSQSTTPEIISDATAAAILDGQIEGQALDHTQALQLINYFRVKSAERDPSEMLPVIERVQNRPFAAEILGDLASSLGEIVYVERAIKLLDENPYKNVSLRQRLATMRLDLILGNQAKPLNEYGEGVDEERATAYDPKPLPPAAGDKHRSGLITRQEEEDIYRRRDQGGIQPPRPASQSPKPKIEPKRTTSNSPKVSTPKDYTSQTKERPALPEVQTKQDKDAARAVQSALSGRFGDAGSYLNRITDLATREATRRAIDDSRRAYAVQSAQAGRFGDSQRYIDGIESPDIRQNAILARDQSLKAYAVQSAQAGRFGDSQRYIDGIESMSVRQKAEYSRDLALQAYAVRSAEDRRFGDAQKYTNSITDEQLRRDTQDWLDKLH